MEADCWKKHPDKIPKKVKAARKKKEGKKTSTAAAAIESKGEDIILGAIECNKIIFETSQRDTTQSVLKRRIMFISVTTRTVLMTRMARTKARTVATTMTT